MPETDLSKVIPKKATWVKVRYAMTQKKAGAQLIARLWSGKEILDPVVIKGESGDVFVKLRVPQKLSYQFPINIDLKLKIIAYKTTE